MFVPQKDINGFGDRVIILTDNFKGYAFGVFTGRAHDSNELYEIRVEDTMTGEKHNEWIHKEDIFQTSEENLEHVREITS